MKRKKRRQDNFKCDSGSPHNIETFEPQLEVLADHFHNENTGQGLQLLPNVNVVRMVQ